MTYATTFSGIGGWELGLNACGWELQWQCECEPFCQALLRERFGVPVYPDIRTLCDENPAPVDALIGSPPCQPFSIAGEMCGTADERHLYPAFIRVVSHLRPRYVLMEQVPNILSIPGAFAGYIGGLAALGYDCSWHCIPACAVGANHRRDRLWIVAYTERGRLSKRRGTASASSAGVQSRRIPGAVKARLQQQAQSLVANSGGSRREEFDAPGLAARPGHSAGGFVAGGANWATEPDVGRVANGVSFRVDRLKALGNAVVPEIPFLIGQAINQLET